MIPESTARKLGTPDSARTGIHLVYSRSWTYQQRLQSPSEGPLPRFEAPHDRFNTALILAAAAMTVPAVWACHSILHSLHLL